MYRSIGNRRRHLRFFIACFMSLSLFFAVLAAQPGQLSAEENAAVEGPEAAVGIESPGIFRVGMEANYAPFNWSQMNAANEAVPIANSSGEYANGYDVWMARQIAQKLGLQLEIVKTEWDGLIPALLSGKIDAVIAGMSPTAERLEEIDFSDIYYSSNLVLVVRKDSPYGQASSLEDFAGARVTGQLNTFHYSVIDQIPGVQKETAMDAFPTMISALSAGKIDAYVSERPGAMAAVSANPNLACVEFEAEKGFRTDPADTAIAVGLRKHSPLRETVNRALSEISEDERLQVMDRMIALQIAEESGGADAARPEGFFASVGAILERYWPLFLRGIAMTMLVSVLGTVFGFLIGLLVQIVRSIRCGNNVVLGRRILVRFFQLLCNIYIEVFRGTPMMVQAMLIFYGGKLFFNLDMSSLGASLIIVSINTGAYLAETIRGGIDSVDPGQWEACEAIGLSHWQAMTRIILPQTLKAIIPAIGNEFVINIKDTSVLNVISMTELFFATRSVAGTTLKVFQSYFITAVIYFILTFVTTRIINAIGTRRNTVKPFILSEDGPDAHTNPAAGGAEA